jgi:branched-chain amino acid transport system permease protein
MHSAIAASAFILLYGLSYGLVLFTIAIGLVITMGLMRVMNLAHGAFAAIGGYLAVFLMSKAGAPYLVAVVAAAIAVAIFSVILERVIYAHLYNAPELDQVLMTLGVNFIAIGTLTLLFGPNLFPITLPQFLRGNLDLGFRSVETYRLFIVGVGGILVVALSLLFDRTTFGAKLRAAVDNPGMARAMGINVDALFSVAFAIGSGLAALGGALGAPMMPLEPLYPLKYLVLVLVVVSQAGRAGVWGALSAAIVVGVVDTAGRYLFPEIGGFVIYVLIIFLVAYRREGLFLGWGVQ